MTEANSRNDEPRQLLIRGIVNSMMPNKEIQIQVQTDSEGMINLNIPTDLRNQDLHIEQAHQLLQIGHSQMSLSNLH